MTRKITAEESLYWNPRDSAPLGGFAGESSFGEKSHTASDQAGSPPAPRVDPLLEDQPRENRLKNQARGGRGHREAEVGDLHQRHESEKGNGHEQDRQNQKFLPRKRRQHARDPAGMKILNLAVTLHLQTLEQVAQDGAS